MENGLNNLGLRDLSLGAGPPQRPPTVSTVLVGVKYRAPYLGQKLPPDGELRGGLSRRDIKSGNHTLPGHAGQ